MRDPLPIAIFGDYEDQRLIAVKCMLLKCGVNDFKPGQRDALGRCNIVDCERAGLFIVSMASVRPRDVASKHGYDLEDWLRAESETLLPIAVKTYDFEDTLIIRAEIPVLTADDFEVSVEPRRIIITDKGRLDFDSSDDSNGKRLFHAIVLPDHTDWASAATAFKDGVLEVEVPKVQTGELLTILD